MLKKILFREEWDKERETHNDRYCNLKMVCVYVNVCVVCVCVYVCVCVGGGCMYKCATNKDK